ncbi:hypothetical protein [Mesorhizobium sp. YM1C-6-2]|uniref:hypothetical protein n=1 Tax=Mesorhizobium sp. YM1C-6-2 TaxID=1827501 RepID=UPI0011C3E371|nr:hypothetical protein [Mesorhizobium sp. YM1C-6-2]
MRAQHRARWARQSSKATARRSPEEIFGEISKAVPSMLPRHVRDEIISSMCLAVLEGDLLIKNIKAEVRKYLTDHDRGNDYHRTLSLDETMPGGKATWIERITGEDLPW